MKKFRIFKSNGKSESIEAERVEWKKTKSGLSLKFFIGRKVSIKFNEVILLVEDSPKIIPVETTRNEIQDDD